VCMTHAVRRHLLTEGVRPRRLTVVYDGIDLAQFRPRHDAATTRATLGLDGGPVIGMAVNIQPWKGQDVTLRAMVEVAAEFPGLVCLLAGGVVRGAEPYAAALDEFIRTAVLAGRVQLLGPRTDVADIVNVFDVAVHSSVWPEPFGRVLIEAMALGKPVIATNAGDARFSSDARQRWDQGAAAYDARHIRSRSRWFGPVERRMYRSLLPAPSNGRRLRVLDAGAGTGVLSAYLAAHADVVSADLSAASLAVLRTRQASVPPVQADLARLPLRPGSFDAVVSNVVFPHLPDELVVRALLELHDVLRPGGTLVFTVFNWETMRRFRTFP